MSAGRLPTPKVIQKTVSFHETTAANVWHFQSGQQANIWQCTIPSHTSQVQGTMCWGTLPKYHCGIPWSVTQKTRSILWGNVKTLTTSQSIEGGTNPIPRWSGYLSREVIVESTHVGKKTERKLHSEHFIVPGALNFLKSARSTELS